MKAKVIGLMTLTIFIGCTTPQNKQVTYKDRAPLAAEDDFFGDTSMPQQGGNVQRAQAGNHQRGFVTAINSEKEGYASWYGKELQGKPTASGEIFDMHKYTAAHRTFSMGSVVMVTNKANGKKQIVRINDRGPYVDGRIIDVSYAAARDLGFAESGVTPVSIELIQAGSNNFLSKAIPAKAAAENFDSEIIDPSFDAEPSDDTFIEDENDDELHFIGKRPKGYTIQIGAFKVRSNAERHKKNMRKKIGTRYPFFIGKNQDWHYIMIGDFRDSKSARSYLKKLKEEGIDVMYRGKVS